MMAPQKAPEKPRPTSPVRGVSFGTRRGGIGISFTDAQLIFAIPYGRLYILNFPPTMTPTQFAGGVVGTEIGLCLFACQCWKARRGTRQFCGVRLLHWPSQRNRGPDCTSAQCQHPRAGTTHKPPCHAAPPAGSTSAVRAAFPSACRLRETHTASDAARAAATQPRKLLCVMKSPVMMSAAPGPALSR